VLLVLWLVGAVFGVMGDWIHLLLVIEVSMFDGDSVPEKIPCEIVASTFTALS